MCVRERERARKRPREYVPHRNRICSSLAAMYGDATIEHYLHMFRARGRPCVAYFPMVSLVDNSDS